jgi:hypothetical protein
MLVDNKPATTLYAPPVKWGNKTGQLTRNYSSNYKLIIRKWIGQLAG